MISKHKSYISLLLTFLHHSDPRVQISAMDCLNDRYDDIRSILLHLLYNSNRSAPFFNAFIDVYCKDTASRVAVLTSLKYIYIILCVYYIQFFSVF